MLQSNSLNLTDHANKTTNVSSVQGQSLNNSTPVKVVNVSVQSQNASHPVTGFSILENSSYLTGGVIVLGILIVLGLVWKYTSRKKDVAVPASSLAPSQ